jgi:hypothetical protein
MRTIPFLTAPLLADKVIQTIASDFLSLNWMEQVYPIAEQGIDDQDRTYPMVYGEDGTWEYYPLLPDDSVKAFCFFYPNAPFEVGDFGELNTYHFSLYVWCRLDLIATNANDFTMALVADCLTKHQNQECFGCQVELKDPWSEFTALDPHENSMLMRKRSGFRIDFSVHGDSNLCESDL